MYPAYIGTYLRTLAASSNDRAPAEWPSGKERPLSDQFIRFPHAPNHTDAMMFTQLPGIVFTLGLPRAQGSTVEKVASVLQLFRLEELLNFYFLLRPNLPFLERDWNL
jgi:hypothetical protein